MTNLFKKPLPLLSAYLMSIGLLSAQTYRMDFEKPSPYTWQAVSEWAIVTDPQAPSPTHVLDMTKNTQGFAGFPGGFNCYFTKGIAFKDGTITVAFRANAGRMDQGGGIMWRVQDAHNYYVARFNPLEDNFRLYTVLGGNRSEIASASVHLASGWHTMTITQSGDRFTGALDGRILLRHADHALPKSGGIGVWTKSDAETSFDDLTANTKP